MIRESFIKMLNERPLNKITVTAIVTECEINRNTFYYYYTDIYEILSEIFQTELQTVIDEYNDTLSWEESFIVAAKFALENKTAVYHVYKNRRLLIIAARSGLTETIIYYICRIFSRGDGRRKIRFCA